MFANPTNNPCISVVNSVLYTTTGGKPLVSSNIDHTVCTSNFIIAAGRYAPDIKKYCARKEFLVYDSNALTLAVHMNILHSQVLLVLNCSYLPLDTMACVSLTLDWLISCENLPFKHAFAEMIGKQLSGLLKPYNLTVADAPHPLYVSLGTSMSRTDQSDMLVQIEDVKDIVPDHLLDMLHSYADLAIDLTEE